MADAEESMLEKLTYQEPVVEEEIVVEEPKKPAPVKKVTKKSEKE
jgi:hypothetical protein